MANASTEESSVGKISPSKKADSTICEPQVAKCTRKAKTVCPKKKPVSSPKKKSRSNIFACDESMFVDYTQIGMEDCENPEYERISHKLDYEESEASVNMINNGYEYTKMMELEKVNFMAADSDALSSNSFDDFCLHGPGWLESEPIDYYELLSSTNSHHISRRQSCDHCEPQSTKRFIIEDPETNNGQKSFPVENFSPTKLDLLMQN